MKKLLNNSRFYILVEAAVISLLIAFVVRARIPGGELVLIRTQQIYGFVALGYWYLALIVSPLKGFLSDSRYKLWSHNRRAYGVSAAYFAILHFAIAFFGQSGGFAGLKLLPGQFLLSFSLGAIGLLVLTTMAATSTDWAIRKLTFPRWKWIHRVGYLAAVLVIVHVWLIGSQASSRLTEIIGFMLLVFLFGLEALRTTRLLRAKYRWSPATRYAVALCIFLALAVPLALMPRLIKDYHSASGHVEISGSGHAH